MKGDGMHASGSYERLRRVTSGLASGEHFRVAARPRRRHDADTMNRFASHAILLALLVLAGSLRLSGADSVALVVAGHPQALIVVPENSSEVARTAAKDLQAHLKWIAGAELSIKSEDALDAPERSGPLVLVGEGELARELGVRVASLPPEGYLIQSASNRLVLAGRDDRLGPGESQQRTAFAVSEFLEGQFDVRWLWPGPLGTVAPARTNITIGPLALMGAPQLRQRIIRDGLNTSRLEDTRRRLGMTPALLSAMQDESRAWLRLMKTGRSVVWEYGHAFTDWWPKYHTQHPTYFARQLDGSRIWPPQLGDFNRVKLCVSQPAVLDQWLTDARTQLEKSPGHLSVSASPNDNGFSGHCLCPACQAWDPTNAPLVDLISLNADGKRVTFRHPALTDRYLRFYNLAAERLAKVAPGEMVGGLAYGAWFTPPVREKVHPNVLISVAGFNELIDAEIGASRRAWDGWAALTTNLILRPNLLHFGHGFPLNYTHWLGQTLRHCDNTGMQGCYWDTLQHHWAAQGLNYYVLAKLLWNPEANVDAIIDDYCRAGFGPAAPAIRRYFNLLESQTLKVRAELADRRADFFTNAITLYPENNGVALLRLLNEARVLAADDHDALARIDFLHLSLTYARIQIEVLQALQAQDSLAARRAIEARDIFYQEQLHSFAIGVPGLVAEERQRRALFDLRETRPAGGW